ncbi:MAG: SIMPL domain-containing protein [Spirochaetaceae bacterium]|nr:SIMPL domain-containing protein [Spirochaetaceae bacterium]
MKNSRIVIFSVGLLLSAVIIAFGLSKVLPQERTVTVRGLSEREVSANLAVWPVTFSLGGNDLHNLQTAIMQKTALVTEYLEKKGLSQGDYIIQSPTINDLTTNPYMAEERRSFQYIAKCVILVRSTKVDAVKNAYENSVELLGKGIAIKNEYDSKISFDFTSLNEIKPEMIREATQNARAAAEQFAQDSGSKVGKIKKATQGLFSINDAAIGLAERKTVRVVTTVEYILAD